VTRQSTRPAARDRGINHPVRAAALGVLALLVLPACAGGSDEQTMYTGADADRIAHVEPQTSSMEWPGGGTFDAFVEDTGAPPDTDDPALAMFYEATKTLDYVGDAGGQWETDANYANLVVEIWATESDAQTAMDPYRSVMLAWARQAGSLRFDEEVDDLGDEAFKIGDTRRLTYKWRRANLVLEAGVGCSVCPPDLDAALREWVDAIDEEAQPG
jgi:hypothetical protein